MVTIMTPRIVTSSAREKEWITEQLMKFNSSHIGISIEEYIVPLNFHLRNQDDAIIAGVNATMFGKSTVYVDILWVDTASRGKDYGSLLLNYVETEARKAENTQKTAFGWNGEKAKPGKKRGGKDNPLSPHNSYRAFACFVVFSLFFTEFSCDVDWPGTRISDISLRLVANMKLKENLLILSDLCFTPKLCSLSEL